MSGDGVNWHFAKLMRKRSEFRSVMISKTFAAHSSTVRPTTMMSLYLHLIHLRPKQTPSPEDPPPLPRVTAQQTLLEILRPLVAFPSSALLRRAHLAEHASQMPTPPIPYPKGDFIKWRIVTILMHTDDDPCNALLCSPSVKPLPEAVSLMSLEAQQQVRAACCSCRCISCVALTQRRRNGMPCCKKCANDPVIW